MIKAGQLIAHAIGDYIVQSDWMASEKAKQNLAAGVHALTYGLPFLFLGPSLLAFLVIVGTHFAIDRWRLARYVVWAKNQLAPTYARLPWSQCNATGYANDKPAWMSVWLLIAADNILHVLCNGVALAYL